MNNVQSDLEALLEIQKDFEIIKELEAKVNKLKNKQATVEKQCKKEIPNTPAIDHTESQRLEKKKKDISVNAGGGYAFGLLAFCAVIAIMGLFLGYGFDKIWCVLGAACLFIGGFAGYVGVAVGCGLCALIGWNVWVHAAIHWQIVLLILGTSYLTYTTSPVMLTDAMERVMRPLKVFRFPVHELAMMMTIALRFIPTLIDETDKIINAQKARGADFETGNIVRRAKALIPILIPLLISAFRRAEELADAMECRCYQGGEGRTRYKVYSFSWRDWVALGIMLLAMAAVILMQIF